MRYDEFLNITGESQRTIINWCDKGLLIPVVDAKGAGTKRQFDEKCVLEARLIRELFNVGFATWGVKKIMRIIREQNGSPIVLKISDSITLKIEI